MKKRKTFILATIAAALIAAAGAGGTLAYFTAYAEAKGGRTISYQSESEIYEDVYDLQKSVVITAEKDAAPQYVRVKAFAGSEYDLVVEGNGWELGEDGFWYYNEPIADGGSTAVLLVSLQNIPEDVKKGDKVNVFVVYESTLALYEVDESGEFVPHAGWNNIQPDEGGEA